MLTEFINQVNDFIEISKYYIPTLLKWIALLWIVNLINWNFFGKKLNVLGIYPRHPLGLVGIFFAPILHANFTHLLFNTFPLFFLALFIITLNINLFFEVTVIIVILSGFSLWCVGRKGIHLGASGVIAGYFGFILANAYREPTVTTAFCALVALYYFGGILFSLFPTEEKTSWEGHLIGFLSGIVAMIFLSLY